MKPIKLHGNFIVYGPEEERVAAFADESDKRLFEAAPELVEAIQNLLTHMTLGRVSAKGVNRVKTYQIRPEVIDSLSRAFRKATK